MVKVINVDTDNAKNVLKELLLKTNESQSILYYITNKIKKCELSDLIILSDEFLSKLDDARSQYILSSVILSNITPNSINHDTKKSIVKRMKEQKIEYLKLNDLIRNCKCEKI